MTSILGLGLVLALVVAHLVAFRLVSSRLGLSIGAVGAVALLALLAHLGALGPLSSWLRRHFHPERE